MRTAITLATLLLLHASSARAADMHWSLLLKNALGEGKDISLFLASGKDGIEGAFGQARRFNKMPHVVDASSVKIDGDRLTGTVNITIPFDGWIPINHKPMHVTVTLDATADGNGVRGAYDLVTVKKEPEKPVPTFAKKRFKSKAAAAAPSVTVEEGDLAGSRSKPMEPGQVCRLILNCRDTVRGSAKARKGQGIGVALSFKDSRSFAARMIPYGSITDVAFTSTAEKHDLKFDGQRLAGTLTAFVRGKEKSDDFTKYDLAFNGLAIGSDVDGQVEITRDGESLGKKPFSGGLTTAVADPRDALYSMTLHRSIPKHNHLNVKFTVRDGKILGGFAVSPHFNNAIHAVDFSKVEFDGKSLSGALALTINPDNWIPTDHKPVPCLYNLDVKIVDGELMGKFTGKFRDTDVAGHAEGSTDSKINFAHISGMTLKVENGAFGRAFITMRYQDGKLTSSNIWNNHDRGLKGSVENVDLDWSNERIRGSMTVRTGRSQEGKLPAYTCKVDGILVGNMGAGSADTANTEGHRKMSTFWVAISPIRK
ncbi:hypothetical protein ACFLQU_00895 [Verrucomicrobiota bacterium]